MNNRSGKFKESYSIFINLKFFLDFKNLGWFEKLSVVLWKMVWLNSWKSCSETFRKIAFLKFLGKYGWWRPLLSGCLAYSLERYWRPIPSQIFSCELFEISDNSNPTRLTSLLNMFWAIQQELFFKPILRKFASLPLPEKKTWWSLFWWSR